MGFLSNRRQRKQRQSELASWNRINAELINWIESVKEYKTQGIEVAVPQVDTGIVLKKGEYAIANIVGSALIENRQVVDEGGRTVITTRRVVYIGKQQHCEWQLLDVAALDHDPLGFTTILSRDQTSNMAFGYGVETAHEVQMRLKFALAICNDTMDEFESALRVEFEQHSATKPLQ